MTRGVATHNEIKDLRPISEQLEIMQMHTEIYAKIDEIAEELRSELYQKTPDWSKTRTPSELFNFEQELQQTLNKLQTKIVGAILEAIHRDTNFVAECQEQALTQRKARRFGYQNVTVRTLSGDRVRIRTPCSRRREKVEQDQARANKYSKETGFYPVLRRLGIVKGNTPRFLAETARQFIDGPSLAEASERLADREINHTSFSIWRYARDFATIALWQRQKAVSNLDQVKALEPAPLAGKRVVVGIDGGRARIRVDKRTLDQTKTRAYTGVKSEPKLFIIYTIDRTGNKEDQSKVIYDGTI